MLAKPSKQKFYMQRSKSYHPEMHSSPSKPSQSDFIRSQSVDTHKILSSLDSDANDNFHPPSSEKKVGRFNLQIYSPQEEDEERRSRSRSPPARSPLSFVVSHDERDEEEEDLSRL